MFQRRFVPLSIALGFVVSLCSPPADAAPQGPNPTPPHAGLAKPMPLDGTWIVLDEVMNVGDFFSGAWVWNSTDSVTLTVTDLFVVSDEFEIYDNGGLIATSSSVLDWDGIGKLDPFDAPSFNTDPKAALASGFFSGATIKLGPGSHEITIRDIHIPPTAVSGPPFIDGTVAFSAEVQTAIPTMSQWGAMALALLLLVGAKVYFGRRRVVCGS